MQQTLLRLRLPEGEDLWPDEFRSILAAQNVCAPELFGRDDRGNTVADPLVRFVGGRRWAGLLAHEQHEEVLFSHLNFVLSAVGSHFGQVVPVQIERHAYQLLRSPRPRFYRVRNVALKRRGTAARDADVSNLVVQRILGSLHKQASFSLMDIPEANELEIANVNVQRQLGMRLKTQAGLTNECLTLLPLLTFSMFAELHGFWFIGNLSARGYGRVAGEVRDVKGLS